MFPVLASVAAFALVAAGSDTEWDGPPVTVHLVPHTHGEPETANTILVQGHLGCNRI